MATAPAAAIVPEWRDVPDASVAGLRTGGELVYAIGDVHGCYRPLQAMLARIGEDAAARAHGRRPLLVLLGDYVDRGPRSADVLEAVVWLRRNAPYEVHALKGNHEQGLLEFLDDPAGSAGWLKYGADETFASYGVDPLCSEEPAELERVRDELLARMPASHLHLLQHLELVVEVGDYAFVHAGIRPQVALADQRADDLLWIRREFLDFGERHAKMIVHGHTWKDARPQFRANRIGIDSGVYSTDTLTALMLDGGAARYLQVEVS